MHQILRLNTFNEQDHGQIQRKSRHQQIEKVMTHNHTYKSMHI